MKSFLVFSVFTRSFLVTASNNDYTSAPVIKFCTGLTDNYQVNLVAPILGSDRVNKTPFHHCMCNRFLRNAFTEPLPRNESNIIARLKIVAQQRLFTCSQFIPQLTESTSHESIWVGGVSSASSMVQPKNYL